MSGRFLLPQDRLDALVRRRVAVFWNDDRAFYPAFVDRRIGRRRCFKVVYEGDDEDHIVQSEYLSFDSTPVILLPNDPRPPCAVCARRIDLSGRMECTMDVAVCYDCSAAHHRDCTAPMEVPCPQHPWNPDALAVWRCPSCLAAADATEPGGGSLQITARDGNAPHLLSRLQIRLFPSAEDPSAVLITDAPQAFLTHAKNYVPGIESVGGDIYVAPFASFEVLLALKERLAHNRAPSAVTVPTSPAGAQAFLQRGDALPRINSTVASQRARPTNGFHPVDKHARRASRTDYKDRTCSLPPISSIVPEKPMRVHKGVPRYASPEDARVASRGSSRRAGHFESPRVRGANPDVVVNGVPTSPERLSSHGPASRPPCYTLNSSDSEGGRDDAGMASEEQPSPYVPSRSDFGIPLRPERGRYSPRRRRTRNVLDQVSPEVREPLSGRPENKSFPGSCARGSSVIGPLSRKLSESGRDSLRNGEVGENGRRYTRYQAPLRVDSTSQDRDDGAEVERCRTYHEQNDALARSCKEQTRGDVIRPNNSRPKTSTVTDVDASHIVTITIPRPKRSVRQSRAVFGSDEQPSLVARRKRCFGETVNGHDQFSSMKKRTKSVEHTQACDLTERMPEGCEAHLATSQVKARGKKLKRAAVDVLDATQFGPACAFCSRNGSIPECEGDLLGPFEVAGRDRTYSLFAHYNCLAWAPETFEAAEQSGVKSHADQWSGYDLAFKRAKWKKCILCGCLGASLQCMYMLSQCCKPMHFRCAILSSASLLVSARGGLHTLCPRHSSGVVVPGTDPLEKEHRFIQTPVSEDFLESGRLCAVCRGTNFKLGAGAILDCVSCSKRVHSRCGLPDMTCVDGVYAVESSVGRFACGSCLSSCDICNRQLKRSSPLKGKVTRDGVKRCVGCNHASVHTSCLSKMPPFGVASGSSSSAKNARRTPSSLVFRCERCRSCEHCGRFRVEPSEWNEEVGSCVPCGQLYMKGAACPVCNKVYRDEDSDMIQCNKCDKWIHLEVCCGLDDAQIASLSSSDEPYLCVRCMPPKKRGKPSVIDVETRFEETKDADEELSSESVSNDVEVEVVSSSESDTESTEQDETDFFDANEEAASDVCLINVARDFVGKVCLDSEFAPAVELCRSCSSGGPELSFRFCANCGEALHGFCLSNALPTRRSFSEVGARSKGTFRRLLAGGQSVNSPPWHCENCAICKYCEGSCAPGAKDRPAFEDLYACWHCALSVHLSCVPKPFLVSSFVNHDNRTLLCDGCQACELCLNRVRNLVPFRESLFCSACYARVRSSLACSVCSESYPYCSSTFSQAADEVVRPSEKIRARVCDLCTALVHAQCDPHVLNNCSHYACSVCRGVNGFIGREVESSDRKAIAPDCIPFVQANSDELCPSRQQRCNGNNDEMYLSALCNGSRRHGDTVASKSFGGSLSLFGDVHAASEENGGRTGQLHVQAGAAKVGSRTVLENGHNDLLGLKQKSKCFDRVRGHCENDRVKKALSVREDEDIYWTVSSADERTCCLCKGKEESSVGMGRLLPWLADFRCTAVKRVITWAHITCVVWSSGVTRRFSRAALPRISTCFLVVEHKRVMDLARQNRCDVCGLLGATLVCAMDSCMSIFHFNCARDTGCRMQVRVSSTYKPADCEPIPMGRVSWLGMYCPSHANIPDISEHENEAVEEDTIELTNARNIDFELPVRVYPLPTRNRVPIFCAARYRLRTGAVMVIRTGNLVPNSPLFVSKESLLPRAYRAVRRHWSLMHPGRRCTYLMDVCGSARTGPTFVIRTSDDPNVIIRAPSACDAWSKVSAALELARFRSNPDLFCGLSYVRMSGLHAFGLADCKPVVSLLEKLPMCSLVIGRYIFKHGETEESMNIPFRVPKLDMWSPITTSGCARVEGLVPERDDLSRKTADAPTYENVPTGDLFQLHVAMGQGEPIRGDEHEGRVDQRANGSLSARRKPRCGEVGEPPSVAFLSHAMQHRAMLRSWRRRTIVLRSQIEGWGVFAVEDIAASEMIVEYSGEIIRTPMSDRREKLYNSQGIGCYMFEISPGVIVDATKRGNRARYINHSCDPNCYSRTVTVENNRRVVVIFAKRNIKRGEELCYDYQFPFDPQDRILCACGASQCKGFMN